MWPGRITGAWPTDLPGMTLWLRSDLGLSLANGVVSRWADQSGAVNDGALFIAPTYPGPLINGYPTLVFLHALTTCFRVTPATRPTTGITLMAVVQEVAQGAFICCQSDITCTDGWGMKTYDSVSIAADWYVGNIAVAKVGTSTTTAGTNHLYVGTWDIGTGVMSFYDNGVLKGTASFAGPISYSGNSPSLWINSKNISQPASNPGANSSVNIAEVGLWPRCLSAGEIALLHSRQNLRYRLF